MPTIKIYGYNEPGRGLNLYSTTNYSNEKRGDRRGRYEKDFDRVDWLGGTNLASSPQLRGTLLALPPLDLNRKK